MHLGSNQLVVCADVAWSWYDWNVWNVGGVYANEVGGGAYVRKASDWLLSPYSQITYYLRYCSQWTRQCRVWLEDTQDT